MDSDDLVVQLFFLMFILMFYHAHTYLNNIRNTLIKQGPLLGDRSVPLNEQPHYHTGT